MCRANHKLSIGSRKSISAGFTLVELLVVITIIGILIALLLPAVQAAREAARLVQCQNNIKQVGLAVLNYESANGIFPPAASWNRAAGVNLQMVNQNKIGPSWVVLVLPFLEQQSVYDIFDLNRFINDDTATPDGRNNRVARGTSIQIMLCPSDSNNRTPFNGSASSYTSASRDGWARGNYAANAALGMMADRNWCVNYNGLVHCCGAPDAPGWKSNSLRGVMGGNVALRIAEIQDGTSYTILLGEIISGLHPADPRGAWAMGNAAISLWGHGTFMGDCTGPNSRGLNGCDNVASCMYLGQVVGREVMADLAMDCYPWVGSPYSVATNQQSVKSLHPGGANVCLGDGSVRFINDFIDTAGFINATAPVFSVWDRLNLSNDGQVIPAGTY